MLGHMIFGGQVLIAGVQPPFAPADFVVTNDAEWNAVLANSAAGLSGKVLEISGNAFTHRDIADRDMSAIGAPLTIRSANPASSLPSIGLTGTVRGIDFAGLNIQMTGWPKARGACFTFNTGTFGKIRFLNGTTFRHGYGAGLADIDTAAELPEYERIDHVRTASTVSAAYPLTWKDLAAPTGWIDFFNRGPNSVRVAVGGPGVVATTTSALVASGARLRITSGVTPAATTHFAVLATTATSVVNARTEIGLAEYLADAFASSGAAITEDLEFRNCLFRDLQNGVKGIFKPASIVVMDCDFDRIYQDIIAAGPGPGGVGYFMRNRECLPFARSGIAENQNGDARDPHGDQYQMFSDNAGTIGPIYYAGNRIRPGNLRTNVSSQGVLVANNLVNPSYSGLYFVSSMFVGGAPIGMAFGNAGFPAADTMIYGATVIDWRDAANTFPRLTITGASNGSFYIGSTIAAAFTEVQGPVSTDNVLLLPTIANPAAVFPNLSVLSSATDRAEIEAAIATVAQGAGLGAAATANAVDWATSDPAAVIQWQNIPSGAHWEPLVQQALGTLITLPLRKILNRRAAQPVSVGAGTEWRKVAADGVTELQAWSASPGAIEPDQFIQIRRVSSATGSVTVVAAVTINGFTQSTDITTANIPSVFLVQGATAGRFIDPLNTPAGTSRVTFRGLFYWPAGTLTNGQKVWAQNDLGCDLETTGNGWRVTVKDGTNTQMFTTAPQRHAGSLVVDTWLDIVMEVNQAAASVTLTVNGISQTYPFNRVSNGLFRSAVKLGFIGAPNGTSNIAPGVRFANLSVDLNGTLHKAISSSAAAANIDPWKSGGVFGSS